MKMFQKMLGAAFLLTASSAFGSEIAVTLSSYLPIDGQITIGGQTTSFSRTPYSATFTFNDATAVHDPSIEHNWTKYAIDSATFTLGPTTSNSTLANGYTMNLLPGLSIEDMRNQYFIGYLNNFGVSYAPLFDYGSGGTDLLAKPSGSGFVMNPQGQGAGFLSGLSPFQGTNGESLLVTHNFYAQCTFAPVTSDPVAPAPEPASLVSVGTGLLGAGLWARRRKRLAADVQATLTPKKVCD